MIGRIGFLGAAAAMGIIVVWAAGASAAEITTTSQTASRPSAASKPSPAVERAMSLAFGNIHGIIYIDVKAMLKPSLDELAKAKEPLLSKEMFEAIGRLSAKASSVTVILAGMPLLAVEGNLGPDDLPDLGAIIRSAGPQTQTRPSSMPAVQQGTGKYLFEDAGVMVFFGGESKLAPKGVTLIAPASLLKGESLPPADEARVEKLKETLAEVDTSAPAWGAAWLIPNIPNGPMLSGQLYPDGKGTSILKLRDLPPEAIAQIEKELKEFLPEVKLTITDNVISATSDKTMTELVNAIAKARGKARGAVSASHLKAIGVGISMYSNDNLDRLPADLNDVLKYIAGDPEQAARVMSSPASGRQVKVEKVGSDLKMKGEGDYVYIRYTQKVSELMKKADSPSIMIAYERPENYKNEKTNVLYLDGHVAEVPIDKFKELLKTAEKLQAAE